MLTDTAVIPAAGAGTRMLPLSAVVPKELFPAGPVPLIEHVVAELAASGIRRICVVSRKGKGILEDYLGRRAPRYPGVKLLFAFQEEARGLGDALRCAAGLIGGRAFVMAIPDQLLIGPVPATRQLLEAADREGVWSSLVRVPREERRFFAGARSFELEGVAGKVSGIRRVGTAEAGMLRGFGRTLFPFEALEFMTAEYADEATGEVDLLKSFQAMLGRLPLWAVTLDGRACDLGSWEGYAHYQPVVGSHAEGRVPPW